MHFSPWYTPPVLLALMTPYSGGAGYVYLDPAVRLDRFMPYEVEPETWPPYATAVQTRTPLGVDVPGGPFAHLRIQGSAWPGSSTVPANGIAIRRILSPDPDLWSASLFHPWPAGSTVTLRSGVLAGYSGPIADQLAWEETQTVPALYGAQNVSNFIRSTAVDLEGGWLYQPPDWRFVFGAPPLHQRQRTDGQGGGPPHHGAGVASRQYGLFARGIL